MANPKYADLPGIAHDQPDVYETNDLPEAEQRNHSTSEITADQCDSVEQLKISPEDAYNKFKGKSLDSKHVDFTDSVGPYRRTGYDARSGDWELVADAKEEKETPIQTYNRLQFEVKQLFEEVNKIEATSKMSSDSEVPPVVIAQNVEKVQKALQDINLEKILGSNAIAEMSDPLGTSHKNLLKELDSFKKASTSSDKKSVDKKSLKADESIKYELLVNPEQAKMEETFRVSSLEQRLKNIEQVVGFDKTKLSFLTSNTDGKNICAAVSLMTAKLNLLDPHYLEQIESRLVILYQCMQQISEKKQQVDDVEKLNKVSELYELVKKVDQLSVDLPQIVERLVSLKELHQQALQFSKALTQLDSTQQQIASSLKHNEALLKEVQGAFAKNADMIEDNLTSLTTRLSALK